MTRWQTVNAYLSMREQGQQRDPATPAGFEGAVFDTEIARPVGRCLGFSGHGVRESDSVRAIVGLRDPQGKTKVSGLVVAVVVDSVNRHVRWHGSERVRDPVAERHEVGAPLGRDADTSPSVSIPGVVGRTEAPGSDSAPNVIEPRARPEVRPGVPLHAAARFRRAATQRPELHKPITPTIAADARASVKDAGQTHRVTLADHDPLSKAFARWERLSDSSHEGIVSNAGRIGQ